ncbi:MAG: tetratricopeptide repeat protein [Pseudomonadota bacterium]
MSADAIRVIVVVLALAFGAAFWFAFDPSSSVQVKELEDGSIIGREVPTSADSRAQKLYWLGLAELRENNNSAAEQFYREALHYAPEDYVIIQHLALSQYTQLKLSDAEANFRRVIKLKPDHAPAHIGIGAIAAHAKDYEKASRNHLRAVSLDPHNGLAQWGAGSTLWALGQKDEALPHLREYVRLLPDAKHASKARAWIAQHDRGQELD